MSQRSRPPSTLLLQSAPAHASQPMTPAEKCAATMRSHREDQAKAVKSPPQAISTRPPRQAKIAAQRNAVWINNDAMPKKRARTENEVAAQAPKQARRKQDAIYHPVEYDDVDDAATSTNTAPVASSFGQTPQPAAIGTKKSSVCRVSQRHADADASTLHVDPVEDESDAVEDEHIGEDSSFESDFKPEDDIEDFEDDFDYPMDEELTWSPAPGDKNRAHDDDEMYLGEEIEEDVGNQASQKLREKHNEEREDEISDDSDVDLQYASRHGVSGLLKKRIDANSLFDSDEGVVDGRAEHPRSRTSKSSRKKSSKSTGVTHTHAAGGSSTHIKLSRQAKRLTKEATKWRNSRAIPGRLQNTVAHSEAGHSAATQPVPAVDLDDTEGARCFGQNSRVAWTPRGNISLAQSSAGVRDCFHQVETRCKLNMIRKDAFPENHAPSQKTAMINHHLTHVSSASKFPHQAILKRLHRDDKFRSGLVSALATRLSLFRGKFKAAAVSKLCGIFKLEEHSAENHQRASELLQKRRYIFPLNANNKPVLSKPYGNPIITEVIKEVLLTGRKRFITNNTAHFRVVRGGIISYLMPKALVALVATAVEAALKDYCSGSSHSSEFLAEVYGGVYNTHMQLLEAEAKEQAPAYFALMSKLFSDTIGFQAVPAEGTTADEMYSDIDWATLEY